MLTASLPGMTEFRERNKAKPTFTPPGILYSGKKRKAEESTPGAAFVKLAENRMAKEAENEKLVQAERTLRMNLLTLQIAKLQFEMEESGQELPPLREVDLE